MAVPGSEVSVTPRRGRPAHFLRQGKRLRAGRPSNWGRWRGAHLPQSTPPASPGPHLAARANADNARSPPPAGGRALPVHWARGCRCRRRSHPDGPLGLVPPARTPSPAPWRSSGSSSPPRSKRPENHPRIRSQTDRMVSSRPLASGDLRSLGIATVRVVVRWPQEAGTSVAVHDAPHN